MNFIFNKKNEIWILNVSSLLCSKMASVRHSGIVYKVAIEGDELHIDALHEEECYKWTVVCKMVVFVKGKVKLSADEVLALFLPNESNMTVHFGQFENGSDDLIITIRFSLANVLLDEGHIVLKPVRRRDSVRMHEKIQLENSQLKARIDILEKKLDIMNIVMKVQDTLIKRIEVCEKRMDINDERTDMHGKRIDSIEMQPKCHVEVQPKKDVVIVDYNDVSSMNQKIKKFVKCKLVETPDSRILSGWVLKEKFEVWHKDVYKQECANPMKQLADYFKNNGYKIESITDSICWVFGYKCVV